MRRGVVIGVVGCALLVAAFLAWRHLSLSAASREVGTVVKKVITQKRDANFDDLRLLGGPTQTVEKVTLYLREGKRSVEERKAALGLVEITFDKVGVPLLMQFAGDRDRDIRNMAIELLSDEFGGDPRAFDLLVATLRNTNEWEQTRTWAAIGFGKFPPSDAVLAVVLEVLQDESERVRYGAYHALSLFDDSPRVVKFITPFLKDPRPDVRELANEVFEIHRKAQTTAQEPEKP